MATIFHHQQGIFQVNVADYTTARNAYIPLGQQINLILKFSETVSNIKSSLAEYECVLLDLVLCDKSRFSTGEVVLLKDAIKKINLPACYRSMVKHIVDNATETGFKFDLVETGIVERKK